MLQNTVYPILNEDKGGKLMEGEGEIPLPEEGGGGGSMTKVIAAIVVIIIVVAAIAGALLLMGGESENEGPTVVATVSSPTVVLGESVTFDGSGSSDPDGDITNWTWNFGDGNMGYEAIIQHTYSYPGNYKIILTVEDDNEATATNWETYLSVDVNDVTPDNPDNDSAPIALAAASAQSVDNNTQIDFNGKSSLAYSVEPQYNETEVLVGWATELSSDFIDEMYWAWGDGNAHMGNFSEAGNANYTYTGDGDVYAAYLRVTSIHDAEQRFYVTVLVLPAGQSGGGGVKNPDTFIEATIGEPKTLDPAIAYDTASGEVLENVYEHLIWYDRESTVELIPQLATTVPTLDNGGISADGLNYTFTLREGVNFHYTDSSGDYYTLDGYDVEYSLERVLTMNDPEGPVWMLAQITYPSWPGPGEVLDPSTVDAVVDVNPSNAMEVTVHLINPYPGFLKVLSYTIGSIVCMEAVEDHGGVQPVTQNEWMERNVAGTGPYMLKAWEANQYVLMERFDDYWREAAPIKFVMIKKVPDFGTRLMMMLAGDADFAYIPRAQKESVEGNADLRIVEGLPTFNMDFLGFNWNMSGDLDVGDVPADFFSDINIRNAFIYAFDYDTYLTDVWQNTAIQPNGPIPLGMFGYSSDIPN
jgi:peptide/nickel transport system substrate-binding protein